MNGKLGKCSHLFVANQDGSLDFSITIAGTLDRESARECADGIREIVSNRIRFEENAIELRDVIAGMPKQMADDFLVAAAIAASKALWEKNQNS